MNHDDNAPKKLIMLVDDSEEDTFLFKHAATKTREDIKVSTFLNSAALLAQLKSQSEKQQMPDLLFIDINMPTTGGIDFLKEIKSTDNLRSIPALMFSTSAYRKDIDFCYAIGAAGYLVKPSGNKDLVNKLGHVFAYWLDTVEPAHDA